MKNFKHLGFLLLISYSIAFVPVALGAGSYTAFIGNHDAVTVDVAAAEVRVNLNASSSQTVYTLSWPKGSITVVKDGQTHAVEPLQADYAETLTRMRDLVAYTMIPARYSWNVFGTEPLHMELSATTSRLDALLIQSQGFTPNCVLSSDEPDGRFEVSVGAYGELGGLTGRVTSAWVRSGYELILAPGKDFAVGEDQVLTLVPSDGLDGTFSIDAATKLGSFACRASVN